MLKIREFQTKDTSQVIELISPIVKDILSLSEEKLALLKEDLSSIEENYFERRGVFLVAEEEERVIGTVALLPKKKKVGVLKRMYVDEACRGKGIGRELYGAVEKWCRERGFTSIILSTYPPYTSMDFYEKQGFVKYASEGEKVFYSKKI